LRHSVVVQHFVCFVQSAKQEQGLHFLVSFVAHLFIHYSSDYLRATGEEGFFERRPDLRAFFLLVSIPCYAVSSSSAHSTVMLRVQICLLFRQQRQTEHIGCCQPAWEIRTDECHNTHLLLPWHSELAPISVGKNQTQSDERPCYGPSAIKHPPCRFEYRRSTQPQHWSHCVTTTRI